MEVLDYFTPIEKSKLFKNQEFRSNQLGELLDFNLDRLDQLDLVIFNVEEDRASENQGAALAGDNVRKYLYQLYSSEAKFKVADLGSIKAGSNITDTYFAVEECIAFFMKKGVLPIIIGGSQDLTYANYKAYTKTEQVVNLVSIDSKFSLGETEDAIKDSNYFSKLLLHQPNVLFNYSNLGYQSYFVDPKELNLLDELFYDIHRLGVLKNDLRLAEPVIRNADFISFSMSAIAQPFSPANKYASPNGFTGEEACQLARYAGMSDKLSSIGLYDYNPSFKDKGLTAHLLAQMIWYFIEGFYQRKKDFPVCNKKEYTKYTVALDDAKQEMVFYKSPKSDRWWMEVPYHANFRKKYERHLMLPCNYEDYQTATENEIPERWFQTFKKLK
jgi:arginase family enzyme